MPQRDRSVSPTGEQWVIAHGQQQAVVTEVGATLRSYTFGDIDVVQGFGAGEWSHSGRGQVLAPWPNRLGDGRYQWGGVHAQAPLDEPSLGNAIHGLVRWVPWKLEAHAQNVVTLRCMLRPTPAYPWFVDLQIEYRLRRDGLVVTSTATGCGEATAPFGLGFHPYLSVGGDCIDSALLEVPASERLVLDGRQLPTGETDAVRGTDLDFSIKRAIGETRLDTAYTSLARGDDGLARVCVECVDRGRGVELWADDRFRYVMCFTGDTIGAEALRRTAVAVEPMTCPPDALRSGRDLIVLGSGDTWQGSWGIRPYSL